MNIEQLEKGTVLRQRIKEANNAQKNLIENYKGGKSRKQLYISFDGNRGAYYEVGEKYSIKFSIWLMVIWLVK